MKLHLAALTSIIIFFSLAPVQARLFFVGSNPYLSKTAFPQDISLIRSSFIAYTFGWQPLPFWGDIDDPVNKPDSSYASVKEEIEVTSIDGEPYRAKFSKDGRVHIFRHDITYHQKWNDRWSSMFSIIYKDMNMTSRAEGTLPAKTDDEQDFYEYILFENDITRNQDMMYGEIITSCRAGTVPLGLKLGFGYEKSAKPKSELRALAHGVYLESKRLLWGWSTAGCNHIFGYKHTTADAWFKNDYSTVSLYQVDVQLGMTFDRARVGARYRLRIGEKADHRWFPLLDFGDDPHPRDQFIENFAGGYVKQNWAHKSYQHIGRIYTNATWYRNDMVNCNLLVFFGVDSYTDTSVHSLDMEYSNNITESSLNVIGELNPNFNIFLNRGIVIDLGLLLEYSWTGYKNTMERWNSAYGGSRETYWDTTVYIGDEPVWEKFSHGEEHFFDAGWEVNARFPLFRNENHLVAFTTMLFQNNKFTFITKNYGKNYDIGHITEFYSDFKRKIERTEIWFNTSFSLFYKYRSFFIRLTYVEPIVYKLWETTRVVAPYHFTMYRHSRKMQTSVFDGGTISLAPAGGESEKLMIMVGYEF